MKYSDFYRLYDLENGFDKIKPLPVHEYSNNVARVPRLNSVSFNIGLEIDKVVDILKQLDYLKVYDGFEIFYVIWKEPSLSLCIIQKRIIQNEEVYQIYAVNDMPSEDSDYLDYLQLIFTSKDIVEDDDVIAKAGWQDIKYGNKCYFITNNGQHPSLDVEFCFFENSQETPKTYSNEELNAVLGSDSGLLVYEDKTFINYPAGLTYSPFVFADKLVYIDEGEDKLIISDDVKIPLKLTVTEPSETDNLFGKTVSDLQSDVVITKDLILGLSRYVTNYTGYSEDVTQQSGNYIAIKAFANQSATITAELVGGIGSKVLGEDGLLVCRLTDETTAIKLTVETDDDSLIYLFSLEHLDKEPNPSSSIEFTVPTTGESTDVGDVADFPKRDIKAILTRNGSDQTIYLKYVSAENQDVWSYGGIDALTSEFALSASDNTVTCHSIGSYTEGCKVTIDPSNDQIPNTLDKLIKYESYDAAEQASDLTSKIYFDTTIPDVEGLIKSSVKTSSSVHLYKGLSKVAIPEVGEQVANSYIDLSINNLDQIQIRAYVEGQEEDAVSIYSDGQFLVDTDSKGSYFDIQQWVENLGLTFVGCAIVEDTITNSMVELLNGSLVGKPKND